MLESGSAIKFNNYKHKLKAPFIVIADFEAVLKR